MSTSKRVGLVLACVGGAFLLLMGVGIYAGFKMRTQYSAAQEIAAIQQLKAVQGAETQYFAQFGKYATALDQLQDSIPAAVAGGKSGGYLFMLGARPEGYEVHVDPDGAGNGAGRRFYSDETLVIRANDTVAVPATALSPELQ